MDNVFEKLAEPFEPDQIHWRPGSTTKDGKRALALAYLDARNIMERLDAVVGPLNWRDQYREVGGRIICRLSLRVNGEWIAKEDGASDSQVEAEKGAISDALKRAAVKFGIGRYLYNLPAIWCELDGKQIKTPPQLPPWALPPAPRTESAGAGGTNGTQGAQQGAKQGEQAQSGTQAGAEVGQPPRLAQKAEYSALVQWALEAGKITQEQRTELIAWLNGPQASQAEAQRRIERWKQSKAEAQPARS